MLWPLTTFVLVFFTLFLPSCATYQLNSPERFRPQRPVTAQIPPAKSLNVYQEEGLASWYGPGFYGRKTASGKRFQKNALTCAHRTLPFGTKLKVTNLQNGKEVEVIVNDRGPAIRSRVVDLSYAAAKKIGMMKVGEVPVELKELL